MPKNTKPRKKYTRRFMLNPYERLTKEVKVNLGLKHYQMVDAIATGEADAQTMYDFCHAVYTWSQFINQNSDDECLLIDRAADMCNSMAERYRKTNRVVLTGLELQTARRVAEWMDQKAEKVSPGKLVQAVTKTHNVLDSLIRRNQ